MEAERTLNLNLCIGMGMIIHTPVHSGYKKKKAKSVTMREQFSVIIYENIKIQTYNSVKFMLILRLCKFNFHVFQTLVLSIFRHLTKRCTTNACIS